jgi:hypothetical protein
VKTYLGFNFASYGFISSVRVLFTPVVKNVFTFWTFCDVVLILWANPKFKVSKPEKFGIVSPLLSNDFVGANLIW